mmetsp:Transcript_6091/g.21990  ORF Transcript_6091/g.21990 Transcript_6091/m.21990 type:complete len:203 (-) Transcript_6091:79-687(-)
MSTPKMRSKINEIGYATTNIKIMKNFMTYIVFAPMYNPCLEHNACGVISPKHTMLNVDTTKPITPVVTLAIKIEISEFTAVFPSKSVHNNKFPFLRTGIIVFAYSLSSVSPPSAMISNPTGSKLINPNVSPENRAESKIKQHPKMMLAVAGRNGASASSHPAVVKQSVAHVASLALPHAATHASSVDIDYATTTTGARTGED